MGPFVSAACMAAATWRVCDAQTFRWVLGLGFPLMAVSLRDTYHACDN